MSMQSWFVHAGVSMPSYNDPATRVQVPLCPIVDEATGVQRTWFVALLLRSGHSGGHGVARGMARRRAAKRQNRAVVSWQAP